MMDISLLAYYVHVSLFLLDIFDETTSFELVNLENIKLPGDHRNCKGRLFPNLNLISCAVLCRYPTAEIMTSFGLSSLDIHDECDWFNHETGNDNGTGTGNCTLCFTASSPGVTFHSINKASKIYSKSSILWRKLKGTMGQISAEPSGVFGAEGPTVYRLYYLNGSRGITNPSEELLDDSDWVQIAGAAAHISSGSDIIAVANTLSELYYARDLATGPTYPTVQWVSRDGGAHKIMVSEHNNQIWVVDSEGNVFYSPSPIGNVELKQLSAEGNEEWVIAVDVRGKLYYRIGISSSVPMGNSWKRLSFKFGEVAQVSVYKDQLWLTTMNNQIYTRHLNSYLLGCG